MQLFLDESGYTGQNLLDPEQPLFTLATLSLPEEECKRIKEAHFRRAKMPELKHSTLAKRESGQRMVLSFLDDLLAWKGAFRFFTTHKRFALTRKFVDHVVEPAFFARGLNLYQGRKDISFANAIYQIVPALEGQAYFDDLLERFHEMLKARTPESVAALRDHLHSRTLGQQAGRLLEPAKDYLDDSDTPAEIAGMPADSLDLSLTITLPMMSLWREDLGPDEPIHLYHDQSSAMAKQSAWWKFLTASDRTKYAAASGAIIFPIGLDQTEFVISDDWAGIQLTDVIAGAFNRACSWVACRKPPEDAYGQKLAERLHRTEERSFMFIFPGETPEHLLKDDGNELISYVGNGMREFQKRA